MEQIELNSKLKVNVLTVIHPTKDNQCSWTNYSRFDRDSGKHSLDYCAIRKEFDSINVYQEIKIVYLCQGPQRPHILLHNCVHDRYSEEDLNKIHELIKTTNIIELLE